MYFQAVFEGSVLVNSTEARNGRDTRRPTSLNLHTTGIKTRNASKNFVSLGGCGGRTAGHCCVAAWRPHKKTSHTTRRGGLVCSAEAGGGSDPTEETPQRLLVVELDGALVDVHKQAHLAGFNAAFKELNLDCANWSPEIYSDLVNEGGGTAEGMINAYFSKVGWPVFLPKEERALYASKIEDLKDKAIPKLVGEGQVRLRDGAKAFLQEAISSEDFKVVVISATASNPEDKIAQSALAELGDEALEQVLVLSSKDALPEDWRPGQQQEQEEEEVSLEQQFANLVKERKKEAVAEIGGEIGVQMAIDSSILGLTSQRETITKDLLKSITTLSGVSLSQVAFVTSSSSSVTTATSAGMRCFAVKNSLLTRGASYPGTLSVFDGFGPGGGATMTRIRALMSASSN